MFDAALYILQESYRHNAEINVLPATDHIQAHHNIIILRTRKELGDALRVLEAAAKVTAQDLADGEWTRKVYPALFAALPDAPKGEK